MANYFVDQIMGQVNTHLNGVPHKDRYDVIERLIAKLDTLLDKYADDDDFDDYDDFGDETFQELFDDELDQGNK
jgi:iron uptake system EfeUOB component EfeO/EfeM